MDLPLAIKEQESIGPSLLVQDTLTRTLEIGL